jgi:two-component SAPR family response regulator
MPKITGVELSKRLHDIRSDIPVVLCTGYNEMVTQGKLNAAGINEYLIKPVQWGKIDGTVRQLLDKKRVLSPSSVQQ